MSEALVKIERSMRKYYPLAAAGLGVLALSGCTSVEEAVAAKTPVERVTFDYVITDALLDDIFRSSQCLYGTAFSAENGFENGTTASYNTETDILTLTASNNEQLLLTGFDQDEHTVAPVDAASQAIFDSYGCEVEPYHQDSTTE